MSPRNLRFARFVLLLLVWAPGCAPVLRSAGGRDPLPSWNAGCAKQAIKAFIRNATTPGQPGFVPVEQRIAVFDNDGTLLCEHPVCMQCCFALDRVRATATKHPEWQDRQPFAAAVAGDTEGALAAGGIRGIIEMTVVPDAGISTNQYGSVIEGWIGSARHPRFDRPYTDLAYQPMLELLAYLRRAGFKNYIVTAGNAEFVRVWSERVYGIPPEQVIGSRPITSFTLDGDKAVLMREPKVEFVNDREEKAISVEKFIGRRPVLAFGNSDGDLPMLEYTASSEPAGTSAPGHLCALIHHTDAEREYAYDRNTKNGHLDKGIEEAGRRGWLLVDMKQDWRKVFPFE